MMEIYYRTKLHLHVISCSTTLLTLTKNKVKHKQIKLSQN